MNDATGQGRLQTGQVGPGTTVTSFGFDGATAQVTAPATGLAATAVGSHGVDPCHRAARRRVLRPSSLRPGSTSSIYRGRVFG